MPASKEKDRAQKIFNALYKQYPNAKIILNYSNPWELLVAVILSAQCTDLMVNKVTSTLFPKYRNKAQSEKRKVQSHSSKLKTLEQKEIEGYTEVPIEELEQDIKPTGFFRNKAKSIKGAARTILEKFNGQVPKTMKEMLTIPGVGRKTANVVLGNAYGVVEGIAVDTHVKKQSQRFGFTKNTNPDKIEQDLMKLFPKKHWFRLTYLLIEHGRSMRFQKDPEYERKIFGNETI